MWVERGGENGWEMGWRRRLFVWEEELLLSLREALPLEVVFSGAEDEWRWRLEDGGLFSVSSVYGFLGRSFSSDTVFNDQELRVFKKIWKSPAPSKVIAFSWKLLRNRVPTRCNLALRGCQPNGGSLDCVHCNG
ncbi:F-box family protein, partial [Trifolium medium]|nr:F-box family protein [Trifolium medium]